MITGNEDCQCLHWRGCGWSKMAVLAVKDMAKESEDFKQVQKTLQQNLCGDDPRIVLWIVVALIKIQVKLILSLMVSVKFFLMKIGQIDYNIHAESVDGLKMEGGGGYSKRCLCLFCVQVQSKILGRGPGGKGRDMASMSLMPPMPPPLQCPW